MKKKVFKDQDISYLNSVTFDFWTLLGFVAQGIFFSRFLVQWIASEKKKISYIPNAFWYLSLIGGALLFIYTIHIKDPVFIAGSSLNLLVYIRNLVLIKNKKKGSNAT